MRRMFRVALAFCGVASGLAGCQHPSVSAVSLNPRHCDHHFAFLHDPCKEPEGIPFYLPKPLLIVSKNFRNIEETKVGLTASAPIPNYFDDQAKYADLNARTNFTGLDGKPGTGAGDPASGDTKPPTASGKDLASVAQPTIYSSNGAPLSPGAVASDGLKPEAFFTYHIIFVPDLTQKYGLKIKGGAGEIRAAMNLVNGWQFTGLGPYYMKDSSTAQNTLAGGISANLAASGVADVVSAVAGMKPGAPPRGTDKGQSGGAQGSGVRTIDLNTVRAVADIMRDLNPKFVTIPAYAQISIYEPYLSPEGTMEWKQIAQQSYDRDVMTTNFQPSEVMNLLQAAAGANIPDVPKAPDTVTKPSPLKEGPGGDKTSEGGPKGGASPGPSEPVPKPEAFLTPGGASPTRGVGASPFGSVPTTTAPRRAGNLRGTGTRPGGLNTPPLQTAPVGLVPTQGPLRTLAANIPKADLAVVRTQGLPTPIPDPEPTSTKVMARLIAGVQTDRVKLSDASAMDASGRVTQSANPAIDVRDVPTESMIELVRNGNLVESLPTRSRPIKSFSISDRTGNLIEGPHTYEVFATGADKVRNSLGQIDVRYQKPIVPDGPGAQELVQPALTAGGVASIEATRQVLGMFPSLLAKRGVTAPVVAPIPGATITPAPTSGSQVTLNQFFGKTRVGAPALASAPRKFSLFHHKEKSRPSIRTLDVEGIDADAAAVSAATTVVPGAIGPAPKF